MTAPGTGTGISREQLATFATKADGAAQNLQSAVRILDGDLSHVESTSKGTFAKEYARVKTDINNEMTRMNQALSATSVAGGDVGQRYTAGDEDQGQQVNKAVDGLSGLTSQLPK